MAIRNLNGKRYGIFSEGVDNTTALDSPDIRGTLSKGDNTDLVDDSLCKKRNGYTTITSAWGTKRVREGLEYKKSNSEKEILVYGEESALTGNSGTLAKVNGPSAPTAIATGLKDGVKPSIVQYRNLAFIFNGKDDLVYDGNTVHQIGINPPTVAPGTISNLSGGLNTNGSYIYVYTYYNSATGAESSPSPASGAFNTGPDTGLKISITPGDSTTADKIKIYRSVAGGDIFFFEDSTDISASSFDSIISDAGLGSELELDNSRLEEPGKFAIVQDNRLLVGGFDSNPNRVKYSKIGINGPMPQSFQATDFTDCNLNDGDSMVGMGIANTTPIILKERSVGRLTRVQANLGGLERSGSQKYLYEHISSEITGINHHTIVSLDHFMIWLGRDDIYGTDGSQIYRFGKRIRKTIKSLNFSQAYKFSATVKTDTQQIIWSVCTSGNTEPDYQIVAHYREFPKLAFTFYTPGTDKTTHPGLKAASLFRVTVNKEFKWFFGSSDAVGSIYQMDTGGSDNSLGIYWDVRLPWDGANNPSTLKRFHSYYIFVAGAGGSPNNTITHTFEVDVDENAIVKTATNSVETTSTSWASQNWGAFNWSSVKFKPLRFYPHRLAYFGRYGWKNTFANQPMAVKALTGVSQIYTMHR